MTICYEYDVSLSADVCERLGLYMEDDDGRRYVMVDDDPRQMTLFGGSSGKVRKYITEPCRTI